MGNRVSSTQMLPKYIGTDCKQSGEIKFVE